MIVVDASALIECLLQTPLGAKIEGRVFAPHQTLHAPQLLDLEVVQVLRRFAAAGTITAGRGDDAVQDLVDLSVHRYPHAPFLPRIWELRGAMTAYDAAYIALAEALDAPLLTCDSRLASARGHRARVEIA